MMHEAAHGDEIRHSAGPGAQFVDARTYAQYSTTRAAMKFFNVLKKQSIGMYVC